ncbi:MAG TPA: hypothetical protein VFR81_21810 [Longimicrobium sp.]|nr:hypothetical protein [Longimicrobium sp.]
MSAATPQDALQDLARTLALTLEQPGMRAAVHQAMQSSRYNEHKLVLQEFAATPAGARVIRGMAAAGRVDESVVRGWIQQVPSMDLYVPFVEHRRGWTGTGDVVVAANMDVDDTRFTGYAPDGSSTRFDSRAGTPEPTVVFLHPAEDKAVRADADKDRGNRPTIEDPSTPVSTVVVIDGSGKAVAPAPVANPSDGTPMYAITSTSTYSGYLQSYRNYDGDGVGGIELYVQHFAGQYGAKIDGASIPENSRFTSWGYEYDEVTEPHDQMWFSSTTDTWITVHEKDQWSNDYWGEGKFGGFGSFVHRFYPGTPVKYVQFGTSCSDPAACLDNAKVDIYYRSY